MDQSPKIEVLDFTPELSSFIKTLNYEWLEKYFRVEKQDEITLSDPVAEIIDKGGFIYYARRNGEIVGTVSLIRKSESEYELSKMAVSTSAQGHGIGKLLLEHALQAADQKGIDKLILYSNTKLKSAIHLYKKYGFTEVPLENGVYERADIKMKKDIR